MSEKSRQRARELVSQMTIEEKISQMLYKSPAIERLQIPAYNWWNEALHGVARSGVATMFPQAIALASSFDTELIGRIAHAIAIEGRAKFNQTSRRGDRDIYKGLTFWAPNVNIFRDPRWGRGHETFGEDPYLTGELGTAYIRGLQGDDHEHLMAAACAKHFAVHSGPESLRHEFDARVSTFDLYDTYLYAFKRCVKEGKVEAVMGAYNRVNGEPACGSKTLLTDILRRDWGFEGHVVSDCWAIKDFHESHRVTKNVEESAALAVMNGCDLNCGQAFLHLHKAHREGLVSEAAITAAVERLIEVRIRLGMLREDTDPYGNIGPEQIESPEHIAFSLEACERSCVLLKNKGGLLPLKKSEIKTLAVIGPNANSRDALIGNYTGTSSRYITLLEGIQEYAGDDIRILYSEGCHLYRDRVEFLAEPRDRFAEALSAAEQADAVIVCLGLDASIEGEEGDEGNAYAGGDKPDLRLPGLQAELLKSLAEMGKPLILLLAAGSAMDLSWARDNVDAILDVWYPGARGGRAVARILFGEVSPSGKLPVSFYENTECLPDFNDYSMKNRTYRYATSGILYPFGFGLSYSRLRYGAAHISSQSCGVEDALTVLVAVTNEGDYAVHEIVQVYVRSLEGREDGPFWQLKAFGAVKLESGETKTASFELPVRAFTSITEEGDCLALPGRFAVSIGGHQPDPLSESLSGEANAEFIVERRGEALAVEY